MVWYFLNARVDRHDFVREENESEIAAAFFNFGKFNIEPMRLEDSGANPRVFGGHWASRGWWRPFEDATLSARRDK